MERGFQRKISSMFLWEQILTAKVSTVCAIFHWPKLILHVFYIKSDGSGKTCICQYCVFRFLYSQILGYCVEGKESPIFIKLLLRARSCLL